MDAIAGRNDEIGLLDGLVGELRAGRGRVLWIEGEPGIGKTTLVGQLTGAATAGGCRTFQSAADELAQPLPLRLLAGALEVSRRSADPVRVEIADLLRGAAAAGAADPVLAAGELLVELVDHACAAKPVLLLTEDLHWADDASLRVWYQLARSVDQIPLLLAATCRPVPRRESLLRLRQAVGDSPHAVLLPLGPLDPDAAADLARRRLGRPPGPRLTAALAQAAGNPLYLRELLDSLLRDGHIQLDTDTDTDTDTAELSAAAGSQPVSLTAAISRRLRFLSADTTAVLRVAAVLGADFSVTDLAAATTQPASALVPAIDEAVAAGVLTHNGERMLFRHDLIRTTLADQIPGPLRSAVHTQLAHQFVAVRRPVGHIAGHLLAAGDTLDDWALDWLATVPEAALRAASEPAIELLRRAVRETRPGGLHDTLAGRLVYLLHVAGRHGEVEPVAAELLRGTADPVLAARVSGQLVLTLTWAWRYADALRTAEQALDSPTMPEAYRGRLRALYGMALSRGGRDADALAAGHRAAAEAARTGDRLGAGYAEHALFLATMAQSGGTAALPHLQRALAVLPDDGEAVDLRVTMLLNRAAVLSTLDRYEESDGALAETLRLAERAGSWRLTTALVLSAALSYDRGRWDQALAHLGSVAEPAGSDDTLRIHGMYGLILGRRGDHTAAARHIAAGSATRTGKAVHRPYTAYLTAAQAVAAEQAGDLPAAVAALASWLDPALGPTYNRGAWMPDLVRVALAAGDTGTAGAAAEAAEADAGTVTTPYAAAAARYCRAQLDGDAAALLDVAGYYRRTGRVELPGVLEEAAVRLAAAGDAAAARAALTEAARLYGDIGAGWDLRRADGRLREHGVRRGSRTFRRRPTTGWAALTPAERGVAELVAAGRSNPDIAAELYLSRHTVQSHVASVLRKLGVHSRLDVARHVPTATART